MKKFDLVKTTTIGFGKAKAKITVNGFIYDEEYGNISLNIVEKIEIIYNGKVVAEGNYANVYDYENSNDLTKWVIEDTYKNNGWDKSKIYTRVGKAFTEGLIGNEINEIIKVFKREIETEYALYMGVETPEEEEKGELEEIAKTAKKIIVEAEKIGIENLITNSQAKQRELVYNLVHNEGGDGYVPKYLTKEIYLEALEIVKGVE